jgi:hypothetical protein
MTTKNTKPRDPAVSVRVQASTYEAVLCIKAELEEEMGVSLSITQALAIITLRYPLRTQR